MNTTEKTEENDIVKDVFKLLGALISLAFGALFFFLKLLGDSSNNEEKENLFGVPEDDYDDLTSTSLRALSNPNNLNHDD